jgi:pSer/pThr/pTyr-binding forkhead associated (FHA) protein
VIGRDRRRQRSDGSEIIDLSQEPQGLTVSREHAWLTLRSGQWRVAPSSRSRNPTMVNGQIVAPGSDALLEDGDLLKVGGVTLTFRVGSSGTPDSEQSESNTRQETP